MMPKRAAYFVSLVTILLLQACGDTSPVGPGSGPGDSDGDPLAPPTPPPIVSVDPDVYALQLSGSFTSTGTSTGVLFLTTGPAMWNNGTCTGNVASGTDGTWVSAGGQAGFAHDSRCIGYWSDGRPALNNRGTCSATSLGYIGLWFNRGGRKTSPYHTKCLMLGTVTSTLSLTFSQDAILYVANDGTQKKILNFTSAGSTTGQLVYHGTAASYTTGAGSVAAVDGDGNDWTIDLTQAAFFWYTGEYNGDVITTLQGAGVEAVACSGNTGCVLTTLQLQ